MRRWLNVACDDATLVAALDPAPGSTGLLIVSGGNEILSGAHGGMALLAQDIAAQGYPVFRFDRRGVGDSGGFNQGFEGSEVDIAAAAAAFREAMPQLRRLIVFGNCDAATALAFFHRSFSPDALILSNPWTIEQTADTPPPAAIRARYRAKLASPREWSRLLRGHVNLYKLFNGLIAIFNKRDQQGLAGRLFHALADVALPVRVILARRDVTALAFADHWKGAAGTPLRKASHIDMVEIETASHSYAPPEDRAALRAAILEVMERA